MFTLGLSGDSLNLASEDLGGSMEEDYEILGYARELFRQIQPGKPEPGTVSWDEDLPLDRLVVRYGEVRLPFRLKGSSRLKTEAASRIVDSLQPVSVQGTKDGFVYTAGSAFGCCRDPFDLCFPTDIASGKSPSEYRTHSGRGSLDLVRMFCTCVLHPLALEKSVLRGRQAGCTNRRNSDDS